MQIFWLILGLTIFGSFFGLNQYAAASSYASPIDSKPLKGIDTIVVQVWGAPVSKLLETQYKDHELYPSKVIFQTIKEVFASEDWLKVIQYSDLVEKNELLKPHMLGIWVALSAQQENLDGKPVTVAAVSLSFKYFLADGTLQEVSTLMPVTFPFIADNDPKSFAEKIKKGVRFLIHYMPSQLCYSNRDSNSCKEADYRTWGWDK